MADNLLTLLKIKNRLRHPTAIALVTPPVPNPDSASEKDTANIQVHKAPPVHVFEKRASRAGIMAADFEINRTRLFHRIFSARRQYLIRGRGFLSAKNGFEVYDMHEALPVRVENDSLLQVSSPKKIHALLLKLVARGSSDTLWVKER